MTYESQLRAVKKYQKEKTKSITIRFFPTDMEVYDYIKSQDTISKYLKGLVRSDMEKNNEQ